jgi:hypothetical protein
MKNLAIVIVSLGMLAGCAAPGPYYRQIPINGALCP